MSTSSNCCSGKGTTIAWTAGLLITAGLGALLWYLATHADRVAPDPLEETDRRIDELESSLRRLRESITHTTR